MKASENGSRVEFGHTTPCQRMSLNCATNMKRNGGESGWCSVECNLFFPSAGHFLFAKISTATEQSDRDRERERTNGRTHYQCVAVCVCWSLQLY